MKNITLISIYLATLCSCGLLGTHKDTISYDPEFNANVINKINEDPVGKSMDSLIAKIDAAKAKYPDDLKSHPLILETFTYEGFLNIQRTRLSTPKDDAKTRRNYKKYEEAKNNLRIIKRPKFQIVYMTSDEYKLLDQNKYPYVLKTTYRVDYDPKQLVVTTDGSVYPWTSTVFYYIMDRRTNEVFGEIPDLNGLSE